MVKIKRKMAIFALGVFLFNFANSYSIYADTENIYKQFIPKEAQEYANDNYKRGIDVVLSNPNLYNIYGEVEDFKLCEPYFVYDVNESIQDPLYYFPIKDKEEKIVLVMAVIRNQDGWGFSIGTDISEELNQFDYLEEECVVYGDEENVFLENKNKKMKKKESFNNKDKTSKFDNKKFEDKKKDIKNNYKVDMDVKYEEGKDVLEESGFAIGTPTCLLLDVSSASVNQKINGQSRGICWAATVATIYNYIMDKHISAKDVCDSINHSYTGGTRQDVKAAFKYFNLDYRGHFFMGFDEIKRYMKCRKPIYMTTVSEDGKSAHAVTLIGYDDRYDGRYISIWNSAIESYMTLEFDDSNTSFGMNSTSYHWQSSFAYK